MCFLFVVCEQTKSLQKCEADMLEGKWCIYRKDIFLVSWEWNTINYVEKGQKCPNKELFLVRIFLYSNWIQEIGTRNNSVFGHFSRSVNTKASHRLNSSLKFIQNKSQLLSWLYKDSNFTVKAFIDMDAQRKLLTLYLWLNVNTDSAAINFENTFLSL